MKSAVSRGVVAVSVVAALGLTAACSGSGDDGKGKGDGGSGGRKPAGAAGTSAAEKLEKSALATGDVKKYKVEKASDASGASADKTAPPSAAVRPGECRSLSDMLRATAPEGAKAQVVRTLSSTDIDDATTTDVELLAYDKAGAEKTMDTLRSASKSKKCATFGVGGHRYFGVRPQPASVGGDESVSFKLASRAGEFLARDKVTVVRSGSTLMSFHASNVFDQEAVKSARQGDPEVADAIVDAQLAKVEK
ncbi:hypothetical protein OG453_22060 [Streptomyces sp. NBC_01381]|uniref:hypothetical protein n=1 Tax=Streptomyces sp. NBC_01381 TaxID=2903845 RepID=UPI002257D9F2|nr:hypothetical protein [Streptomyces sp. NBC_01381]MCX4669327.1 hypothetical protein [Streptomyces sp. NBC_01381]